MSHQLPESRDKFVQVIAKRSSFDFCLELLKRSKMLAPAQD